LTRTEVISVAQHANQHERHYVRDKQSAEPTLSAHTFRKRTRIDDVS
jgi:hypothetical protein